MPNPLHRALPRLRDQGERYVRSLYWLVRECIRICPAQWRSIVLATALNLASNALVIGAVYLYVRLLERDAELDFAGVTLHARESPALLIVFALAVLTGLVVYAVSSYIARVNALRISRRFHEEQLKLALRALRRLPDPRAARAGELAASMSTRRLVYELPRQAGWAMRFIANATPALFTFIIAYGGLWSLASWTTLLVSLLGVVLVAAQYPSSLFAAASSNRVEETRADTIAALDALVDAVDRGPPGSTGDALDERIETFFDAPKVRDHMRANVDRFRAMDLSALTMQAGGAVVLAATVLTLGATLLREGDEWALLVAYVGLLRLLVSSATSIFRAVTLFSRFSPSVQIYREFMLSAARATAPLPPAAPARRIVMAARAIDTSDERLELAGGALCAIWNRNSAGRDLALVLQLAMSPPDPGPGRPAPTCSLVLPEDGGGAALGVTVAGAVERALERARNGGASLLLIDRAAVEALPAARWQQWRALLSERCIGIVHPLESVPAGDFDESHLIVRAKSGELYWMPILARPVARERINDIRPLLTRSSADVSVAVEDELEM